MTLTVFRAGNSWAVTIPKKFAVRLNMKVGDKVVPTLCDGKLAYEPARRTDLKASPELQKWLISFKKRYGPAMRELAKR